MRWRRAKALQIVEKAGYTKPSWETPAAFASMLVENDPAKFTTVISLTDLYYEIRFGGRPLDEARSRMINDQLDLLHRTVQQPSPSK